MDEIICKNIIIFDDLAVFSSYPKDVTLNWLRNSVSFLSTYSGMLNQCPHERILINISKSTADRSNVIIQSHECIEDTVEMLKIVTSLLERNEITFFCPT